MHHFVLLIRLSQLVLSEVKISTFTVKYKLIHRLGQYYILCIQCLLLYVYISYNVELYVILLFIIMQRTASTSKFKSHSYISYKILFIIVHPCSIFMQSHGYVLNILMFVISDRFVGNLIIRAKRWMLERKGFIEMARRVYCNTHLSQTRFVLFSKYIFFSSRHY